MKRKVLCEPYSHPVYRKRNKTFLKKILNPARVVSLKLKLMEKKKVLKSLKANLSMEDRNIVDRNYGFLLNNFNRDYSKEYYIKTKRDIKNGWFLHFQDKPYLIKPNLIAADVAFIEVQIKNR